MQVETLKSALRKLEQKLPRRSRRATDDGAAPPVARVEQGQRRRRWRVDGGSAVATFDRMKQQSQPGRSGQPGQVRTGRRQPRGPPRGADREDEIEKLLGELKARRARNPS